MPISVRDGSAKWKTRATAAAPDFKAGVQNPRRDWAAATKGAEAAYTAGVQAAITNKSFSKGVDHAGTDKWQRNASTKGADRYAAGVSASGDNYKNGFAPYASALANVNLPPRGAKGSDANYNRSKAVGQALHTTKQAVKSR